MNTLARHSASLGNLLVRTLSATTTSPAPPGNVVVPDLATDTGEITNNGKTYTFKLKDGVKFGPPLNRAITSKDILFAFQRIGTPSVVAQYGFYYDVIKGMTAFKTGKSKVIQGIKTPDLKTISFDLTEPTGDFRYRLAMPAAGPHAAGGRGMLHAAQRVRPLRHLVGPVHVSPARTSSNATSCDTIKASGGISGFDGTTKMDLVRNPSYNAEHGQPRRLVRICPDEFTFTTTRTRTTSTPRSAAATSRTRSPARRRRPCCASTPARRSSSTNDGDRTWYFTMNLTQPPFDDMHVRRRSTASSTARRCARPGAARSAGTVATHIAPDNILANKLKGYAPYGSGKGDVAKAKAEMKLSKYDTNHDGICDATACKNIFCDHAVIARSRRRILPTLDAEPEVDRHDAQGPRAQGRLHADPGTVRLNIPFSTRPGWGKDYADPYDVLRPALRQPHIIPTGNTNWSRRTHAGSGQEVRRQGHRHRCPEHRHGPRQVPDQARGRAPRAATPRSTRSS